MNIYIDTEFNSLHGEFLSIGMVAESGENFYQVAPYDKMNLDPWVAANVIPVLNKAPIPLAELQRRMGVWLMGFRTVNLIADFPPDIEHFCKLLITGPGTRLDTPPLTMEIRRDVDTSQSKIPHNALADAVALRAACWSWS